VTVRKKKPPKDDRLRPWDDRPISYERWLKHRDHIMASTRAGSRPEEWWTYEKQMPQPRDLGDERITLFEMAELTETELAELMPEWREEYERANEPNFSYCTGHGWLRGEAAKRAQYRWAGIPRALIRKWDAARRRRAKTIRKLAEPPADSGVAADETDGADSVEHRIGAVTTAGLAGRSAGAPFDVKATRDGLTGASVLEEEVEAAMSPLSHCHEKRDDDAIQSARRSLTESDVGGRANTAPSTLAVVASGPLPPTHGGAGGFRCRRS
jgi:hypothetical protein